MPSSAADRRAELVELRVERTSQCVVVEIRLVERLELFLEADVVVVEADRIVRGGMLCSGDATVAPVQRFGEAAFEVELACTKARRVDVGDVVSDDTLTLRLRLEGPLDGLCGSIHEQHCGLHETTKEERDPLRDLVPP